MGDFERYRRDSTISLTHSMGGHLDTWAESYPVNEFDPAHNVGTLYEQLQRLKNTGDGSTKPHGKWPDDSSGGNAAPRVVPDVYFDEDFHLENPRTFHVVTEKSDVVTPNPTIITTQDGDKPAPRKALATNAILQEKLSWYMDAAEVHLIDSISVASAKFFPALGSLRELHTEAAESVEKKKGFAGNPRSSKKFSKGGGLRRNGQREITRDSLQTFLPTCS